LLTGSQLGISGSCLICSFHAGNHTMLEHLHAYSSVTGNLTTRTPIYWFLCANARTRVAFKRQLDAGSRQCRQTAA
jgi:hypothetical protein